MDTAAAHNVEMVSDWMKDPKAYDPSAIMRWVRVDGVQFTLRSVMGYGWPVCIKRGGEHVGMAGWENWAEVAEVGRAHLSRLGLAV